MNEDYKAENEILKQRINELEERLKKYTCGKNHKKYYENNKEFIWNTFFNIRQTRKNYVFDYTIITDGYATSLRFLHKDFVEEEQSKKDKKKQERKHYKD